MGMNTTHILSLSLALFTAASFAFGSCGHTAVVPAPAQAERSGVLAQLDELTAPAGVPGDVFSALKAELERQLVLHKRIGSDGKLVSVPPTGEGNRVNEISYREEGGSNILVWSYRLLGDYDQNGSVSIADLTPIAMNFGRSVADYPAAEPVDGSGNGSVGIEDVTPIAQNFGVNVTSYDIEGSDDAETGYSNVGNILFEDALAAVGWLQFEFDLGATPAYEWYRVVPLDASATPGTPSLPVHFIPGGGGGLVIFLISAAESGAGLLEDPYVVLVDTAYEIGVEDEHGNPFELPIDVIVYPPFVADATDTPPYTVTPSGDLIGDFYVYATAEGGLESNQLHFRVEGLP